MKRILSISLILCLVLGLAACGSSKEEDAARDSTTWQEQYDLGIRYLSEGNYEEAIIAFTVAIEIDPKLPEAYIGLADVYTAQGNTDKAMEILNQALEVLGENEIISAALEALKPTGLQPLEGYPKTERIDYDDQYTMLEYDEFGRLIRETIYAAADDVVTGYWEYAYEDVVRATGQYGWRKVKEMSYEADGTLWMCREYLYTSGSTAVTSRESFSSGTAREFPYTMQSVDNYIEQVGYRSDGNEEHALIQEWDLDWKIIQEIWVTPDGTIFPRDAF